MRFIFYDIIFLAVFLIASFLILYSRRQKLRREGLLLLYKTKWGIKVIDKVSKRYKGVLSFLSYISIGVGYFLMAGSLYLFGKILWVYLTKAAFVKAIRVPPIMPIIPYIDKIIPSFGFPSFYFTYFIVILALIAIPHEFFHGIFMRLYKIKIKSTGFGFFPFFFPVFLAAFVEQDEKSFERAGKFEQMAVLSAGTFANLITAILFFAIAFLFFTSAFHASGIIFDDYAFNNVPVSKITSVNGISLANPDYRQISELVYKNKTNRIIADNEVYAGIRGISEDKRVVQLYYDSPALRSNLKGIIIEADGKKISSFEDLGKIINSKSPGDLIEIKTNANGRINRYAVALSPRPFNSSKAWIGIYFLGTPPVVVDHKIIIPFIARQNIYYEPVRYSNFFLFLENLLEWIILISFSVALVNMLPVGIFDGGRFFYLTVWGITKKEKIAQKSFKAMTFLALFLLFLMMLSWVINVFLR